MNRISSYYLKGKKLIEKSFNKVKTILNSNNIVIKIGFGIGTKDVSSWE